MTQDNREGLPPFARPVPQFGPRREPSNANLAAGPDTPDIPAGVRSDGLDNAAADESGHNDEPAHPVALDEAPHSAAGSRTQDDAAASTGAPLDDEPSDDPYALYPLSVDDIRTRLFALGISKSKDSIQRYCREGTLDCVKLGMLRRYYATEVSVDALLETLQNDAAASDSTQLHEAAGSAQPHEVKLHAAVPGPNVAQDKNLRAPASTGMQEDAAAGSGTHRGTDNASQDPKETEQSRSGESGFHAEMVDFLKDQIRVKDHQIRLKDEQIAAMLERDRETNVLIRNLQARIGDAFGVLVAGKRKQAEWSDAGREAGYADVQEGEDAP